MPTLGKHRTDDILNGSNSSNHGALRKSQQHLPDEAPLTHQSLFTLICLDERFHFMMRYTGTVKLDVLSIIEHGLENAIPALGHQAQYNGLQTAKLSQFRRLATVEPLGVSIAGL